MLEHAPIQDEAKRLLADRRKSRDVNKANLAEAEARESEAEAEAKEIFRGRSRGQNV